MDADVIVVGSGPSGVSAAWPLVEAGRKVMLLDQGRFETNEWRHEGSLLEMRTTDPDQWQTFFGADFSGIDVDAERQSPKFKVPAHQYVHRRNGFPFALESDGIFPTLSLARGGISAMWGAGAFTYEDADLTGCTIDRARLAEGYKRVAARIGISGSADDDLATHLGDDITLQPPVDLHPAAARLLQRYERKRQSSTRFQLGRTRNAVITDPAAPQTCHYTNKCMWGCPHNAIYSAAQDVARLEQHENFTYVDGAYVESIERNESGYTLACNDLDGDRGRRAFQSELLVLAAGTLSTTRLVLDYLEYFDKPVDLGCHPAFALGVVVPELIGTRWADKNFALGHLAYKVDSGATTDDYAFGVVFSTEGLLASDLIQHMPLTQPRAIRVAGALVPAMLVLNGYLHSRHGQASVTVSKTAQGASKVRLAGEHAPSFQLARKRALRVLIPSLAKLGALPLPGSSKVAELGTDGHFCGTLPVSDEAKPLTTDSSGQLYGHDGLYIADGCVIPHMTAKHPTFTFMANADRIGRGISERLMSTQP